MIDLLESGGLYPKFDFAVDARAVSDAIVASDVGDHQGSFVKFHLIPVRDRLAQGIIRRIHWADTRDIFADGLAKGSIDRSWLHNVCNVCSYELAHEAHTHPKQVGSTISSAEAEVVSRT